MQDLEKQIFVFLCFPTRVDNVSPLWSLLSVRLWNGLISVMRNADHRWNYFQGFINSLQSFRILRIRLSSVRRECSTPKYCSNSDQYSCHVLHSYRVLLFQLTFVFVLMDLYNKLLFPYFPSVWSGLRATTNHPVKECLLLGTSLRDPATYVLVQQSVDLLYFISLYINDLGSYCSITWAL